MPYLSIKDMIAAVKEIYDNPLVRYFEIERVKKEGTELEKLVLDVYEPETDSDRQSYGTPKSQDVLKE